MSAVPPSGDCGLPAEMLRQVASRMREDHGPEHERHAMWAAMADLLENAKCSFYCDKNGNRDPYCSACEDSTYDHECPPAVVCGHSAAFQRVLAVAGAYFDAARVLPPGSGQS